jgi:hypothetical protein
LSVIFAVAKVRVFEDLAGILGRMRRRLVPSAAANLGMRVNGKSAAMPTKKAYRRGRDCTGRGGCSAARRG